MAETLTPPHTGSWSHHDDDCLCGLSRHCNRDGWCWSCCGACKEDSDCSAPNLHPTHWNHPKFAATRDRTNAEIRALAPEAFAPPVTFANASPAHRQAAFDRLLTRGGIAPSPRSRLLRELLGKTDDAGRREATALTIRFLQDHGESPPDRRARWLWPSDEPEHRPFLEDIRANLDDDAPRLVYADWLLARDSEDERARGEWIALSCRGGMQARLAALEEHRDAWVSWMKDRVHGELGWIRGFPGSWTGSSDPLNEAPLLLDFVPTIQFVRITGSSERLRELWPGCRWEEA